CFAPRFSEAVSGVIVCGATRVTVDEAEPLTPVAVIVTLLEAGSVAGAVYKPLVLMVPAVAVQLVAPLDVNCCFAPTLTVAVVGEIVCGVAALNVMVSAGPSSVPGFITCSVAVPGEA